MPLAAQADAGPGPAPVPVRSVSRYAGFDRLRAGSMLFIVLWHVGAAYSSGFDWLVEDHAGDLDLTIPQYLSMGFTLTTFFVMSGFFARMLFQQRGIAELLSHRSKRILLPLAIFVLISAHFVALLTGGPVEYKPYHLWFLLHLYLITVLVSSIAHVARSVQGLGRAVDVAYRWTISSWWAPLVLAAPTFPLVVAADLGLDRATVLGSIHSFAPDPAVDAYYLLFFLFGWLLYDHADLLDRIGERSLAFLALGVLLRGGMGFAVFSGDSAELVGGTQLALQICVAIYSWLMVIGFVGLFHRKFTRDTPAARYISDSSYWCYLIHPAPLLALHYGLSLTTLPVVLKYTIAASGTAAAVLLSYEYCVRYTPIGTLLNGRRRRPEGSRRLAWTSAPMRTPTGAARDGTSG